MAGTARILFSAYDGSNINGRTTNLPGALTIVRDVNETQVLPNGNTATILSVIELLPSGLNQGKTKYRSVQTAAAIQSAST